MQTFVPYPDFTRSAICLDNKRLGKQRVECLQILKALAKSSRGWVNHPATKMWRGCEIALCWYGIAICNEWIERGYEDTCKEKMILSLDQLFKIDIFSPRSINFRFPYWWEWHEVHSSHRAALLHKDYGWYSKFGWKEKPCLDYHWPV
jgi:hypothetical protein